MTLAPAQSTALARSRGGASGEPGLRVAVTGAGGFLGRYVVRRLSAEGYRVRGLYHRRPPERTVAVDPVQGSLTDDAALDRLVRGSDVVVHLAGLVAAARAAEFDAVNHAGTARLAARSAAAGVKRFLMVSSLAARQPELSPYAASKYAGERAIAARDDLPADVLRPPAVYGPGDPQILTFLKLLRFGIAPLPGPPGTRVCVVHADDVAAAIDAWLAAPTPSGTVYEIADGRPDGYGWQELMETAAAAYGARPWYLPLGRRTLMPLGVAGEAVGRLTGRPVTLSRGKVRELTHPDWRVDPTAFARATGWRHAVALWDGLTGTVAWYRANGWL